MSSRMRPLLPRTGGFPPLPPEAKKRKRTSVACTPCRQKKCNGARPTCAACNARQIECHYTTQDESETQREARTREHKGLGELIECLRTTPEETAQAVLYELRSSSNPLSVLRRYESSQILQRPSEITTALSALPQIHSQTELQLMVQHPAAYPALNLTHDAIMSSNTLLETLKILPFDIPCRSKSQPVANIPGCSDVLGPKQDHSDIQPTNDSQHTEENEVHGASKSTYFDPLLRSLHIGFWTSVSVTDHYAAGAISAFLVTDHSILRLFDVKSFLNDLIHLRSDHCSPFLVSSLLAFASQQYSTEEPLAAAKSFEFEKEAEMIWRAKLDDSMPNITGLILLYTSIACHGQGGPNAESYIHEATEMCKRMKLFGVRDLLTDAQISSPAGEDQRAGAQTAWGAFNYYILCVNVHIAPPVEDPPALSIPEKSEPIHFDEKLRSFVQAQKVNSIVDETYIYTCKLFRIHSDVHVILRDQNMTRLPSLAFIFSKYMKYLELIDSLPERIRRRGKRPLEVLQLHLYFHMFLMDLFRPFIDNKGSQEFQSRHPNFTTPEAIFAASTKPCANYPELKELLIECVSQHNITTRGCTWHTVLLYTANALVTEPASPDLQFFFLLCMNCYARLYDRFEFAEGAVQSLLAIAVDHRAISKDNAAIVFNFLMNKMKFRQTSSTHTSLWPADLNLAMKDREAAAIAALADRFEVITVFDEFTEGVVSP
ncbi:hypothetical protein DM02DRAFT_734403 [Periconia macrospinosa]|uniref:Zn(2)-C6 fungal-type domain-containing protein n=1 Tax=Periconia macrospinosa TaxID=97972 RepID=A0A2V1D026_9PLEO|nr:hypothetical protein DM02DRAFT_734403 [Periconia macrospinosa]